MSQPKRYFFIGDLLPGQTRYPHHHFVLYDDYAALAAENEQLKAAGLTLAESSDNAIWSLKQQLAVSEAKVAWLQKADRLVIWNGTEWQVRHVVEGEKRDAQ